MKSKSLIIISIVFILFSASTLAAIEASLAGFDETKNTFQINIWNKADKDYTDVSLIYRGIDYGVIVPLLKKGTYITLPLESSPGTYALEINTATGEVFKQEIEFSMTKTQIKEKQEKEAEVLEKKQEQQRKEQKVISTFVVPKDNTPPETPIKKIKKGIEEVPTKTISIALLASIIIIILLLIITVLSQHEQIRSFAKRVILRHRPLKRIQPSSATPIYIQRLEQKHLERKNLFSSFQNNTNTVQKTPPSTYRKPQFQRPAQKPITTTVKIPTAKPIFQRQTQPKLQETKKPSPFDALKSIKEDKKLSPKQSPIDALKSVNKDINSSPFDRLSKLEKKKNNQK